MIKVVGQCYTPFLGIAGEVSPVQDSFLKNAKGITMTVESAAKCCLPYCNMKQNREIGSDVVSNPSNSICILKRQNPVLSTFDLVVCNACTEKTAGMSLWEFLDVYEAED